MTRFRDSRWYRRITAGSILFGIILVSSVAYAAWTASGGGQGYAKAGTAVVLTTNDVSASTVASLYPSGSGSVRLSINNPNPYPVSVATVTGSGTVTSDKGAACDAATGVSFVNQTGLSLLVPANSTGTVFTLAGAVTMSNASDNTCQGGIFTIPVTLSGASS
jgi:hypothetical protein